MCTCIQESIQLMFTAPGDKPMFIKTRLHNIYIYPVTNSEDRIQLSWLGFCTLLKVPSMEAWQYKGLKSQPSKQQAKDLPTEPPLLFSTAVLPNRTKNGNRNSWSALILSDLRLGPVQNSLLNKQVGCLQMKEGKDEYCQSEQ